MADRVDRRNNAGNLLEDVAHSLYGEGADPPDTAWPEGTRTWPTPTASDWKGSSQPPGRRPVADDDLPSRVAREMKGAAQSFVETGLRTGHYSDLDGAVVGAAEDAREWPTPTASNNRKSKRALTASSGNGRRSGGGQSSPPALEQAVELAAGIVPKELEGVGPDDLPVTTRNMLSGLLSQEVTLKDADPERTWPTPTASDATGGSGTQGRQGGPNLRSAVDARPLRATDSTEPQQWAADMDLDGLVDISSDNPNLPWHIARPTVKVKGGVFPTPSVADSFHTDHDGFSDLGRFVQNDDKRPPRRSKEEREAARANRGPVGQLNPDWVEWLMGWPVGWTSMSPMSQEETEVYATTMPGPWWRREPAHIPRITVGTVDRVGRLKACGNGQVPLANAAAFEVLLETFRQIEVACAHGGPGEVDARDILGL
jgi:hypothetical protein